MIAFQKIKLGDVTELITKGTTPSTIGRKFTDTGINYIKSESITKDGFINEESFSHIDEETHKLLGRSIIKEGDILFSIAGIYLAKSAIVKKRHLPANTNQAVAIIRLNHSKVDCKYINYYFSTKEFIQKIYDYKGQAAQPNISLSDLKSLDITIPRSRLNQRTIASVISSYDDLIENNENRIKILEEMSRRLYKEWFVKFNFPGQESVKMVDSGTEFGMIPEGWKVNSLGKIADVLFGFNYKSKGFNENGEGFNVVRIRDVLDGITNTFTLEKVDKKYLIESGDLLIGMDGIFHMCMWFMKDCYLNQRVARIRSRIPTYFIYESVKKQLYKLQKTIVGATVGHLSNGNIRDFKVVIPSDTNLFSPFIGITNEIINLKLQNQNLSKIRDLLTPQLVTGKREVKQ